MWVKTVRDYFIGKCPDAELMLKWAEQCPAEITNEDVDNCGYGTVVHPTVLSGHVWAWLKAVLREQAMTMFLTAPKRNGLAAWRALCKYVSQGDDPRKEELRRKLRRIPEGKDLKALDTTLSKWEQELDEFYTL